MRSPTDGDPLALNVQYVAPAGPGPATFEVDVLRAGRSHATLQARLFQDDLEAVALATFGRRRTGERELLNTLVAQSRRLARFIEDPA